MDDKESPWVTPDVKAAINRNKRIYRNWIKRGKIECDKPYVNAMQRETNKIIKKAKKDHIENLSSKICDPQSGHKVFWNAYKRLVNNKKNTNIPPIVENGKFVTNFHIKTNMFNEYFARQCRPLNTDSALPLLQMKTNSTLHNIDIEVEDIVNIINKLKSKKAHGFDGISIALVKSCSLELAYPLKLIFSKCIEVGIYPDKWKHANVQPVYRKIADN